MTTIEEKVYGIVCEHMGRTRESLNHDHSFTDDLGADSLDTVEIVMQFENAFNIQIPDEDAEAIQTVGKAIQYITSKTTGTSASPPVSSSASPSVNPSINPKVNPSAVPKVK